MDLCESVNFNQDRIAQALKNRLTTDEAVEILEQAWELVIEGGYAGRLHLEAARKSVARK